MLKPGVLPAYDEALSFLSSHSESLRKQISSIDKDYPNLSDPEKAQLKESLEIAASINDPSTLAAFQASDATTYDASNAAFRHLRERLWRKDSGVLAKVMERCRLMHVLPDVIGSITPEVDVQIAFGQGGGVGGGFTDHKSEAGDVLVGAFVPPEHTLQPPQVNVNVFHTEPKKYTLVIVDPDQPDEDNQSYKTGLVALKSNISLSATDSSPSIDLSNAAAMDAEYIPPHPQQGTNYHRYTTLLFEQSSSSNSSSKDCDRSNFDLAQYILQNNLVAKGIHFWRAKWSPESATTISHIYRDILKQDEPKYTKPPTLDKVRKQIGDIGSKWF